MVTFVSAQRWLLALDVLKYTCMQRTEADTKTRLHYSFLNPLSGLSSADLSLAHYRMNFCLVGLSGSVRLCIVFSNSV